MTAAAGELVVPAATVQSVVALAALENVAAGTADKCVATIAAVEPVGASSAAEMVVAGVPLQPVAVIRAGQVVVADAEQTGMVDALQDLEAGRTIEDRSVDEVDLGVAMRCRDLERDIVVESDLDEAFRRLDLITARRQRVSGVAMGLHSNVGVPFTNRVEVVAVLVVVHHAGDVHLGARPREILGDH